MTLTSDRLAKRNFNVKTQTRRRRRQLRPSRAITYANRFNNTEYFFLLLQANKTDLIYSLNKATR